MSVDSNGSSRSQEREESGIDILGFFNRRKWLIFFGLAVGLGLGFLEYRREPPTYRSSGRVNVIKQQAHLPVSGVSSVEPLGMRIDMRNDIELIMSETIIGPAVEGFEDPESHVEIPSLLDLPTFAGTTNPVPIVAAGLKVSQTDVGSSVLVISFEGSNPEDCGKIINNVIRSYQLYLQEAYQSVAAEAVSLLDDARGELHGELRLVEQQINDAQLHAPPGVTGNSNIHQMRMTAIETERSNLLLRKNRLSTQLEQIDAAIEASYSRESILLMIQQLQQEQDGTINGQPRAFSIAQQIFPLLLEEADLLERFGEDHPQVKAIRRQIEMTRGFLEENLPDGQSDERVDFLTLFIQSMELELSQIDAQLATLDPQYEFEQGESRKLFAHSLELQSLQSEHERLQTMWEGVVTLLQNLNLTQAHGEYRAEPIALAGTGHKVAPNLYSSLPIGGILGLLVGMILAVVAETADKSFKNPTEIAAMLGVRVIGHTPVLPRIVKSKNDPCKLDPSLIAHYKPKSRSAESFRAIRTALYFNTRADRRHRVIQLTSPDPRDGKSTTSANLAISIAQSGKKTLLIDADFRRPRVQHLFGIDDKVGMSSVITNDVELPEAIQTCEVENLDLLPCGPRPDNPAELLTSSRFDELLEVLRDKYDFVLIDSPPILAVTDPGAIASRVDGVLLVLRISVQARHAATQAVEILRDLGANMLGVIVNGVEGMSSYGYRGYGYGYGYGYAERRDKSSAYYAESDRR